MSLEIYERDGWWWFRGKIDRIPGCKPYRQSSGVSSSVPKPQAYQAVALFEEKEVKRHYAGDERTLTFAEAVLLYDALPMEAKDLALILPHLGDRTCASITGQAVRDLGPVLYPENSTDSWHRHIITPVRAVINHAHKTGKCAPIRIDGYDRNERMRQDRARGKQSRIEKTPGSWAWINAFRAVANPYQKAMASFMFETGCRISQACEIGPNQLDLQNGRVWMPEAKGVEAQWVDISTELTVELANLVPRKPRPGRNGGKTRACTKGQKVFGYASKDGVYKAWKTACKRAGIEEIMPHAAGRHGFATEMLVRHKLDAATVAKMGRWSDMALMQKTYQHAGDEAKDKVQAALKAGRENAACTKAVQGPAKFLRKARK